MDAWNAANPKNPKDYYIAKVSAPMDQVKIGSDPNRMQQLQTSYNDVQALLGAKPGDQSGVAPPSNFGAPRGGFLAPRFGSPGGFGPPGSFAPAANNASAQNGASSDMYMDRLTQEDRRDDWEMKVEVIVVIDPPPATAAPVAAASP
jgi:hypothetical protein